MALRRDAERKAKLGVCVAGSIAMLIGGFWLAAWMGGWAQQSAAAGEITVKTNMALGQLLSGACLILLAGSGGRVRRTACILSAGLVFLIGILTFSQHLFGLDLGIDQLIAMEPHGASATVSPNRMGPIGSLSLTLIGIALLGQAVGKNGPAPFIGIAVAVMSLFPAVGFLYGIRSLYSLPRLTGIAWQTVVCLTLLGIGLVLSNTDRGPAKVLLRKDAGGKIFRQLLPIVIFVPLVLGYLWVIAGSRSIIQGPADTGLFVIILILLFGSILWRVSARMSRQSSAAEAAHEARRRNLDAMTRLHELGALNVREGNLEPILREIVDAAIDITGADFGHIQLIDPGTGNLLITAQRGFPPFWLDYWNHVEKEQGSCGAALRLGERVIVEDVERSPIFAGNPSLDIQRRAGVRAVQSTPLISRSGKPLGMFSTSYKTAHRHDADSLRSLDLLARQAADIIERAQAEAELWASLSEKETLLKELAHRTKNNMQVIVALLGLQAAASADEKLLSALSETQDRIRAMALVHEKLYKSGNFASLNAKGYIEDLMEAIFRAHQEKKVGYMPDLENVSISIDIALPLGLIVNELVSNSLKHAFPGHKSGTIFLSLKMRGGQMELLYWDDGPGLPRGIDLSTTGSLGLKLVHNLATRQLRGTLEIKQDAVTRFLLTFGLSHIAGKKALTDIMPEPASG